MKRKAESSLTGKTPPAKKRSKNTLSEEDTKARFRKGLFDKAVLEGYATEYGASTPYKHCVISELVDDKLLRAVRDEIRANVSFTPKETDIYKIHQSGDLANLDGLDDEALAKLPSLLALRDALYSQTFRDYVSHITACGPLSGRKTDMAINVYTPGCYLLCHDDVIGSRKVSYILYLTDPDLPWKPEWGGALRLYPVSERTGEDGVVAKTPGPDVVKSIPPAWNQLSFFAVQPGESFHDVEEVYHAATKEELRRQGGRIRMAISGWFHIPQPGEDGYVPGAEEKAAKNSSLMQLQGNPDQYDRPLPRPVPVADQGEGAAASDDVGTLEDLNAEDLDFLLRYIAPTYLTPDTLEQVAEHFDADSSITLPGILCASFAERLRAYVEAQEAAGLPDDSEAIEAQGPWKVARPPHKHRFLYQQPGGDGEQEKATTSTDSIRNGKGKAPAAAGAANEADSPIRELLEVLLPSRPFRAWLQVATKSVIESHDLVVRRFRRGNDYTLATGHDGKPRLELNLGFTPTTGWGDDDDEEDADEDEEQQQEDGDSDGSEAQPSPKGKGKEKATNGSKAKPNGSSSNGTSRTQTKKSNDEEKEDEGDDEEGFGGHEVYMGGDDEDDNEDAAVYKSSAEDDNVLFFQAAAWNKMTLVLRDSGTLRFVKYVSRAAPGDRWDISGTYEIREPEGDEEDGEDDGKAEGGEAVGVLDDTEEEFKGFSSSSEDTYKMQSLRRVAARSALAAVRASAPKASAAPFNATQLRSEAASISRICLLQASRHFTQTARVANEAESAPTTGSEIPSSPAQNTTPSSPSQTSSVGDPTPHGVFVRNIVFDASEEHLTEVFSKFGNVVKAAVARDARGLNRGYGFVWFDTAEAAALAISEVDGSFWHGRRLVCTKREPPARQGTPTVRAREPTSSLFIGNIPYETTDDELNRIFKGLQNVKAVRVAVDRVTGWPRGFAHADFIDVESAQRAAQKLRDMQIAGRELRVDYATPREDAKERRESRGARGARDAPRAAESQ